MKDLIANLKSGGLKRFFINHGEKLAFVLVALFVAYGLFSTRWLPYGTSEGQQTPEELQKKVDDTKTMIARSQWPEAEKMEHTAAVSVTKLAESLLEPVQVAKFDYSTPLTWPLNPKKEPIKEPEWLSPLDAIASAGRVVVRERPISSGGADSDLLADQPAIDPNADVTGDPFRPRDGVDANRNNSNNNARGMRRRGLDAADVEKLDGAVKLGGSKGDDDDGGGGGGRRSANSAPQGRGYSYVSVRAVFPIREQMIKLAHALNNVSLIRSTKLEFYDFKLERQTAIAGPDPWAGPWEPVDRSIADDVLDSTSSFDLDPVGLGVTNDVFTMPLPMRVLGYWTADEVSHPRIAEFKLSEEQMKQQVVVMQKILEDYRKHEVVRPQKETRGFSGVQENIQGAKESVMRRGQQDSVITEIGNLLDPDAKERAIREDIAKRVNAQGTYLLFRFLDFSVVPGNAFRYRVKLVMYNPNYNRALDEVADASVVADQFRETPWSEPTTPVIVPEEVNYFLARANPGRGAGTASASLEVFQWHPSVGTTIEGTLRMSPGQFIADEQLVYVVDPAAQTYRREDMQFTSGDMLLDMASAPEILEADHPDLDLSANPLLARERLGIPDQAVAIDDSGELRAVLPAAGNPKFDQAKALVLAERAPFEAKKDTKTPQEREAASKEKEDSDGKPGGKNDKDDSPIDKRAKRRGKSK